MGQSGLWIDGEWLEGNGTELTSTSPSDESIVWQGNGANDSDVAYAFAAARKAFREWSLNSVEERIELIERFAARVKERAQAFAECISREMGKPLWESKTEVGAVAGKAALAIDAFRSRRDTTEFDMPGSRAVTRYKPHGVLGVLGPFNLPAHLPNGHIIPAILAGNTIVFKPSEKTPAVGQMMMELWQQAGLPNGVVNMVQGGRETGSQMVANEQLDGLLFTGSSGAGRQLHRDMSDSPHKILALEMGGNNPLVIHQCEDLQATAYSTILSAFITSGQRCTCARRLIVVNDRRTDALIETLVEMIATIRSSTWDKTPEPFLGTVVDNSAAESIVETQQNLLDQGATSIVPLERNSHCAALLSPGLIDTTSIESISDDECFGPLLQLTRVDSFENALDLANATSYGLSAGLFSDSAECYKVFMQTIRAGVVNWNRQTTGASGKLPFGGIGDSGNHRPSGYFAADYCSYPVASLESETLTLPEQLMQGIDWNQNS